MIESDKPYGEILDEMDHQAKYQSATITDFALLKDALRRAIAELEFARVFVATKQRIHPTGLQLYDETLESLKRTLAPLPS